MAIHDGEADQQHADVPAPKFSVPSGAILVLVLGSLTVFRADVVRAWPKSASAYAAAPSLRGTIANTTTASTHIKSFLSTLFAHRHVLHQWL